MKKKIANVVALVLALSLAGCPMAPAVVATVGSIACGALGPILGSRGEWWGTACQALTKSIAAEIEHDIGEHPMRARVPCDRLVPVPENAPTAWVCPGFEGAAKRAMGAAAGSSLPTAPAELPVRRAQ